MGSIRRVALNTAIDPSIKIGIDQFSLRKQQKRTTSIRGEDKSYVMLK